MVVILNGRLKAKGEEAEENLFSGEGRDGWVGTDGRAISPKSALSPFLWDPASSFLANIISDCIRRSADLSLDFREEAHLKHNLIQMHSFISLSLSSSMLNFLWTMFLPLLFAFAQNNGMELEF